MCLLRQSVRSDDLKENENRSTEEESFEVSSARKDQCIPEWTPGIRYLECTFLNDDDKIDEHGRAIPYALPPRSTRSQFSKPERE
jgi:hypothetical protein